MRIKKKEQSVGLLGKIVNLLSNSKQDTYSCDYINTKSKELQDSIPTKTSQLTNDSNFVQMFSISRTSLNEFKNYLVNDAPKGVYMVEVVLNGAFSAALVQKANNNYLSFIHFGYGVTMAQYTYNNGWNS